MSRPLSSAEIAPKFATDDGERRRSRPFLQYDVFTDRPLTGNQLAVFTDAQGLEVTTMQGLAREMNFPESTFILPVEWAGTDIRMRIFTPATEMPIAGHPTIGSTFALAEIGIIKPATPRFMFHLNVGPTPVDLEWDGDRLQFAWMTQPNPAFGPIIDDRAAVATALSLEAGDLLPTPVQQVSCGVPFLYVPLRDAETVDRAISDASALRHLAETTGLNLPIFLFALDDAGPAPRGPAHTEDAGPAPRGPAHTEDAGPAPRGPAHTDGAGPASRRLDDAGSAARNPAYNASGRAGLASAGPPLSLASAGPPVSLATADPPITVYSRMFAPQLGIDEDPATGIASGPLGSYLVKHGLVTPEDGRAIVSRQGVAMGRASQVHISVTASDGVISDVKVGGQAVLVARGEFFL